MYKTVDDYKEEDVYETVLDYETVIKDIFEEKQETIEKYSVKLSKLQAKLISLIRDDTTENINSTLAHAEEQVKSIKKQFQDRFDKLDKIISDKYRELENCASAQKEKEKTLAESRKQLAWIEQNIAEINSILDM